MKVYIALIASCFVIVSCGKERKNNFNEAASDLHVSSLDFNPFEGQLISSGIDAAGGHMFTLYGNAVSVTHARGDSGTDYPAGSVLWKITWKQQPDPGWFGANIPSSVVSLEVVRFTPGSDGTMRPAYRYYAGDGSGADAVMSQEDTDRRINAICGIKAAVMP